MNIHTIWCITQTWNFDFLRKKQFSKSSIVKEIYAFAKFLTEHLSQILLVCQKHALNKVWRLCDAYYNSDVIVSRLSDSITQTWFDPYCLVTHYYQKMSILCAQYEIVFKSQRCLIGPLNRELRMVKFSSITDLRSFFTHFSHILLSISPEVKQH